MTQIPFSSKCVQRIVDVIAYLHNPQNMDILYHKIDYDPMLLYPTTPVDCIACKMGSSLVILEGGLEKSYI